MCSRIVVSSSDQLLQRLAVVEAGDDQCLVDLRAGEPDPGILTSCSALRSIATSSLSCTVSPSSINLEQNKGSAS